MCREMHVLVAVSDIFVFFCSGSGKGESEAPGRGGGRFFFFFIENPRRTVGAEGPGGCLRRIGEFGGGGAKYLNIFLGAETSTKMFAGKPMFLCILL